MSSFFGNTDEMYVIKRDGERKIVSFDKILQRIKKTGQEIGIQINYTALAMKVIDQLYDGISTTQIDELTSEQCASMASIHPDYNSLAGRILVSNHQKNTDESFVTVMNQLYNYLDKHGKHSPLVSEDLINAVNANPDEFNEMCDYSRDYLIDYFGFKTLERAYLMKINKKTVERPQHMWLRVAIGIHGSDMDHIHETYELMSQKYFTHATPTLFNAGTPHPQLSSCFLLALEEDSIDGIYGTLKDCALISKWAGGIGLHIHNVRATGSHIRGTNGTSNGIVPMLRVFNNTAKYVDQCVTPDTLIYTTDGLIPISECIENSTKILNVDLGDDDDLTESVSCPTPDGSFVDAITDLIFTNEDGESDSDNSESASFNTDYCAETIEKIIEHPYEGTILNIRTHLPVAPLKITSEHPIYAVDKRFITPETFDKDLDSGLARMEWIDAGHLSVGDYLVYKAPDYVKDHINITPDRCLVYGILLRGIYQFQNSVDSYNIKYQDPKYYYAIVQNEENVETVTRLLEESCTDYEYDGDSCVLSWKQSPNLPFNRSDFFQNGNRSEVRMGKRWLYLPKNKAEQIYLGFGDSGWIFNSGARSQFVSELVLFYLRLDFLDDAVHSRLFDTILKYRVDGEYTFLVPITSIMETEYNGILYDLQLTDHHNYMLESGIVHNGGGKRNGSFAIYLEPWHADIEAFLQMRKNHGDEELKARDLFYALWIPDLFMERVKSDGQWTLMCPDECPGLADVWGDDFVNLYTKYEGENKGRSTVSARKLWFQILDAQMETGTPYILYKDACNRKSNQQNLGTIKSSNLCSEIVQYSDSNESAVCNLASIALPSFIDTAGDTKIFDFEKLHQVARKVTYNLNCVIDINYYPTTKTATSNQRHRPIGIGVQGLADVFFMMGYPFDSEPACELNRRIFETIYHAALEESCALAQRFGPYETFVGSPASRGELQFDLWSDFVPPVDPRYNWDLLKHNIRVFGLRNSLLLAPMPTASTSQILGFNECIEPITSNIYSRRTLAGEFVMANKYLMNELIELGLWNEKIKNNIIANHGSVQQIDVIPAEIREKYKTAWELPMRSLIDMAADRGAYICQSQSLNLWLEDPTYASLTSMHFYSWNKGLKTGMYYLRRRGRHQAQQFTIEPKKKAVDEPEEDDICEMCSS